MLFKKCVIKHDQKYCRGLCGNKDSRRWKEGRHKANNKRSTHISTADKTMKNSSLGFDYIDGKRKWKNLNPN